MIIKSVAVRWALAMSLPKKLLILTIGAVIFLVISFAPYLLSDWITKNAGEDREELLWIFGLTSVIWLPLSMIAGVFATQHFLRKFWPPRRGSD